MTPSPLQGSAPDVIEGRCRRCGVVHALRCDPAPAVAALSSWWLALQARTTEPHAHLAALLDRAGGHKMLAVLVGRDRSGATHELRAFSGDLLGHGDIEGCAPSIIRREDTAALEKETLRVVAELTTRIETGGGPEVAALKRERREASRRLMAAMIDATRVGTRGGLRVPLRAAFCGGDDGAKIPSGTADCALPKVLHAAFAADLEVISVAEASWAPGVLIGERAHGRLASPCLPRCVPILGTMLCPLTTPPTTMLTTMMTMTMTTTRQPADETIP
jgi:hypothetical protein